MHDEKRPGDLLKVPGDPLDDVADDVRYGIYTFITSAAKPDDFVLRDELRALAELGDLTSAAIRYQQRTEELEDSGRPRVSRPVELHHRPLAEPSMRLSPHSAPIR